jgi:excisionase family DNA binding protein
MLIMSLITINPNQGDQEVAKLLLNSFAGANIPKNSVILKLIELVASGKNFVVAQDELEIEINVEEAAELLNVSSSYLIKMLDQGKIPYYLIDSSRKLKLEEVLAYKQTEDLERMKVLDELTEQAQELNMGY